MDRNRKIILFGPLVVLILASLIIGFYWIGKSISSRLTPPETEEAIEEEVDGKTFTTNPDTDVDTLQNSWLTATVSEIEDMKLRVKLNDGQEKEYQLGGMLLRLCKDSDQEVYQALKIDPNKSRTGYLVKPEELVSQLKEGANIELLIYEYTPYQVLVKAVVLDSCQ